MKSPLVIRHLSFVIAALGAAAASAAEWFVSPTGSDSAAGTEAAPFRTITNAVERASAEDTIILLPGDHVEGSTSVGSAGLSRANVTKKLTIRSKDGRASRDTTRIVGAYATGGGSSDPVGIGEGAIRGLRFASGSSGSRVEGITFYRGSTITDNTNSGDGGGGALVPDTTTKIDFVDCAFVECRARRGGGIYANVSNNDNTRAVRCLFKSCADLKFGSAMRGGSAYFCVFDGNYLARSASGGSPSGSDSSNARPAFSYGYRAINCTFVNNQLAGLVVDLATCFNGGIFNNLFQRNQDGSNSYGVQFKGTTISSHIANGYVDGLTNQVSTTSKMNVFSPYDGDYRLTVDSDALGAGSTTPLSKIPEEFRYTDYNGATIDPAGPINAGAVQEALTEAASGIALVDTAYGSWTLDGETVSPGFGGTWIGTVGWPVPQHIGFVPKEGRALVRFTISDTPVWPLMDDTAWFHTWKVGIAQGVSAMTTENIYYADPVNGDDTTGDGSEANPYKTLNKAVHKTTANFVVRALPGDYNEGGENHGDGIVTRVVVPKTLAGRLRVVAVDGPENTFITGASDSTANGTGNNAVRCIAVASTNAYQAAFQGFTLRNGRTGPNGTVKSMGAALSNIDLASSSFDSFDTGVLLDCVITNCSGNRAATIAGGSAYRCRFYNCRTFQGGGQCIVRYCSIVSSSFTGCGGSSELFGNTAKGYNCTIYGSNVSSLYNSGNGVKGYLYNSVTGGRLNYYADIGTAVTSDQVAYTLYEILESQNSSTFATSVREKPMKLLGAAFGDYRLSFDSAGAWLASTSYLKSCMDIDGIPFSFKDGRYQAGCHAIREGSTIYVDAAGGSDANDGSSEAAAFQTLAAAMTAADYCDTVVALPGTYDSGTMLPTIAQTCWTNAAPTLPARVIVKGGVTLESRDGAEATVIKGAAAATSNGCGDGAVRGVFLCVGATLRGFTVTGGRTLGTDVATIDHMGGGICGAYNVSDGSVMQHRGLVENCIVSNNYARTGGGAQYGTYRNCLFSGNAVFHQLGFAICRGSAEGCVFNGNGTTSNHSVLYDSKVVNCTILGGQAGNNGVVCNEGDASHTPILNSIILGNYTTGTSTNNYFLTGAVNKSKASSIREGNNITGDASVVDADGKPVAGAAVIDAGDNALASAALLASRDPAGTRRVLNSTIDIGAYEYDWGVPWGAAIGNRRLVIDDMPSDATLSGNALVFGGQVSPVAASVPVTMTWTGNDNGASYDFTATVTGAGTLTVSANGTVLAAVAAADGAKALSFNSALASNSLVFAYDGAEPNGVALSGFSNQSPTVLVVR